MPLLNSPLLNNSPQPFGQQSFTQLFLNDVKMRLVDNVEGMTKSNCEWSKRSTADILKWINGDQFAALSLPSLTPNNAYQRGGGSYNTQLDGTLLCRLFVRNEGDTEITSIAQMRDEVFGDLVLLQRVITAFQTWQGPIDPKTQMSLFNRPMLLSGAPIVIDDQTRDKTRWSVISIPFQLPFVADLKYPYVDPSFTPVIPPSPPPPPPSLQPNWFGFSQFG